MDSLGMDGIEVIAPVAVSPLDSMRGRGKSKGISHERYTSSEKQRSKNTKPIVILVLPEKQSGSIVGHKNGRQSS